MKKLVAVILLLLIALAAAGGVKTLDYTATIPDGYKLENMAVVAYVLRNFNDRPVFQSGSYGTGTWTTAVAPPLALRFCRRIRGTVDRRPEEVKGRQFALSGKNNLSLHRHG